MKLKVKIKDTGMVVQKVKIADTSTLGTLLDKLVQDGLLNIHFLPELTVSGFENKNPGRIRLSSLFDGGEQAVLASRDVQITLTHKKHEKKALADDKLLDYSKVVQTVEKFDEIAQFADVAYGTVFYIQQQEAQFLIRREARGIEVFYFKEQYDNAFLDEGREPFLAVALKAKAELSKAELKWIRSIMLPSKERRNPLIDLGQRAVTQGTLDDIAMLFHRLVVVIGKFQKNGECPKSDGRQLPTYVQVGEECSIGYVGRQQLEDII